MLPSNRRLTRETDFSQIYKQGRRVAVPQAAVFYLPRKGKNAQSRFGFVVSKKQIKKTVDRNRVKRKLRHQTQILLPHIQDGFDLVIHARAKLLDADSRTIEKILKELFRKAGIWKIS